MLLAILLAAAGWLAAAAPAEAQVPTTFRAGAAPLISPETEHGMVAAISAYRSIVAAGGWPSVAAPPRGLRPNDSHDAVAALRRRLEISGDLAPGTRGTFYDAPLRDGVLRFQARHGLRPTGVVAGLTLAHMNLPAEERLQQLTENLKRLKAALGRTSSGRSIVVNAPDFELQAVEGGRVALATPVIVGKRSTQTPDVAAVVQAVDLSPYWHVPQTIAVRDLVPTIRKDPAYLPSKKIRVFSSYGGAEVDPAEVNWFAEDGQRFVFRQDPGPQNALGLIRLDMPNRHIVYMHDTPMKDLFRQDERAFSAGCVRVQNVAEVAAWLIGGGTTGAELLKTAAAATAKQTIKLAQPVPVQFVYMTAWVSGGTVQFRNDLYNRDAPAMPEAVASTTKAPFQSLAP